jgi:hypothetical protein
MSEKKVLDQVDPSKRSFVKGVVATTAFVVPTMVSFDMDSMTVHVGANAYAASSSNMGGET